MLVWSRVSLGLSVLSGVSRIASLFANSIFPDLAGSSLSLPAWHLLALRDVQDVQFHVLVVTMYILTSPTLRTYQAEIH